MIDNEIFNESKSIKLYYWSASAILSNSKHKSIEKEKEGDIQMKNNLSLDLYKSTFDFVERPESSKCLLFSQHHKPTMHFLHEYSLHIYYVQNLPLAQTRHHISSKQIGHIQI